MATSIGPYALVFLPGEPAALTENLGRPQSTGSQRVGHYQSDPACISSRLFCLWQHWRSESWVWRWHSCLACGDSGSACGDTDCLHPRSYGSLRVFCWASCGWWSKGLFGQSFSIAPPIQALRGLPCLGSFSVVWCIRHIEGPPWLGSYSIVPQAFDGPASLLFSCRCWHVERGCGHGSTPYTWLSSIALLPWLPGFPPQAFPTTGSSLTPLRSVSLLPPGGLLHIP